MMGPKGLDRDNPLPLWAQLLDDLRKRLSSGEFTERFPTDRELTESYGVSRNTAREAVRQLGSLGLLDRRPGRGTHVRQSELEQPLGAMYSLFRAVEAQGVEQRSIVRALELRAAAEPAARLGVDPADTLVYLERLRLAGGTPLALDRAWLPGSLARPLLDADFTFTALYDQLAVRCGVEILSGEERIRPVVPEGADRSLLALRSGEPAFAIERLSRSADRAVEYRQSLVRGDRYCFVAEWSAGSAYTGRMAADPGVRRTGRTTPEESDAPGRASAP